MVLWLLYSPVTPAEFVKILECELIDDDICHTGRDAAVRGAIS
jgi:hypothetical protein